VTATIIVQGIVQGVGYRFFVLNTAKQYNVAGYVRNLSNGSVEIVAEGTQGLLQDFIQHIKIGPVSAHVTGIDVQWKKEEKGFTDFDVRF
jgi:acylphosphatase